MRVRLFVIVASLLSANCVAQTAAPQAAGRVVVARPAAAPGPIVAHTEWPAADPEDVKSPDAIIAALSDAISGEAGQERNVERLRSLFVPGVGRMISTRIPKSGQSDLTVLTPDEYAARTKAGGNAAFYERPIANTVETFGRMTHVYESYELKHTKTDAQAFGRGVNSWELFFDGKRYWVVQVYWDQERVENPISEALLKGSR